MKFENNKEIEVKLPNSGKMNPIIGIAVNPENQKEIVITPCQLTGNVSAITLLWRKPNKQNKIK